MSCPHVKPCGNAYVCNLRQIQIQGIGAMDRRGEDSTFARDMAAYSRLRANNTQPQQIGGSAELEAQASTKFEIEHKVIMSDQVRRQFASTIEASK